MSSSAVVPVGWRVCIATWSIVTTILGLPGNIFVLHACFRHKAIKFGRVPVILIQNIAFADICNILAICASTTSWTSLVNEATAAHFYNNTMPGKVLCFAIEHITYWCPSAAGAMICALNVCKLLCLLYPLRGIERMARWGYLIAVMSWALYLPRLAVVLIDHGTSTTYYNISEFRCGLRLANLTNFESVEDTIMGVVLPGASGLVMLITTAALLLFIRNAIGLNRNAILVNVSISGIFLVSYIPYITWIVWRAATNFDDSLGQERVWMFAVNIYYCNLFCNPIIYYATSRSFQQYTHSCFLRGYRRVRSGRSEDDQQQESLVQDCKQEEPYSSLDPDTGAMESEYSPIN